MEKQQRFHGTLWRAEPQASGISGTGPSEGRLWDVTAL